jgi:hypothetical protein
MKFNPSSGRLYDSRVRRGKVEAFSNLPLIMISDAVSQPVTMLSTLRLVYARVRARMRLRGK